MSTKHWSDEFNEAQEAKDPRISALELENAKLRAELKKLSSDIKEITKRAWKAEDEAEEYKAEIERMKLVVEAACVLPHAHGVEARLDAFDALEWAVHNYEANK